jgi:hypothetical protein
MKTTFLKSALLMVLSAGVFSSCINDDDYQIPNLECNGTSLAKTIEVEQVPATANVALYNQDDVIEAYVTSSDEGGNFFKSISFQTLNGSKGFSVPVDVTSTFTNFEPGRKVLIKLKGRYTDISNGGLRIGGIFVNSSGTASVGRLSEANYRRTLNRSCTVVNENQLVRTLTIAQAKQDINLNTLIELDGVQFTDPALGKRYYESSMDIGGATNHLLTDATGNTIIFRTSSFANFAGKQVPNGFGKVRGVLTKFGSDYQFFARLENDVKLTGERIEVDFAPPLVGNNINYLCGGYTDNFEAYTAGTTSTGQKLFPNYINDAFVGSAYWVCRSNGTPTNKFIQMTAFSTGQTVKTYFIVPVNFSCANNFSFQSRNSFSNGSVLKVYYSTNYTPGGSISAATLTDITSSFTISTANNATGPFTNSGIWTKPGALTGNGFILFEYSGSAIATPAITTNMDIDNIVIN